MFQQATYRSGAKSASHDRVETTEWGAVVLDEELEKFRQLDNGDYTAIFGVLCRLVGACKGGHIDEGALFDQVFAAGEVIGRDKSQLRSSLNKAFREVEPRGPKGSSPTEYELGVEPAARPEPPSTPWADPVAVHALWDRTVPCVLDDDAYQWLMLRGISPQEVEFQRLARFLPRDAIAKMTPEQIEAVKTVLPKTKLFGEWGVATRLGYRMLLPVYDADGVLRSLRLRLINIRRGKDRIPKLKAVKKSEGKKALSIKGRAKGGVLANGPALELLRGNRPKGNGELVVVIAEGEPDFLVASLEPDANTRAVFGIPGGGSWSLDIAARIPQDARVEVATDSDPPGISYFKEIAPTLQGQRVLHRWRPWSVGKNGRSKHDLSDVFGLRGGESHVL